MKRLENGEVLTPERKELIRFLNRYHNQDRLSQRKALVDDYWEQIFIESAPLKKYGFEKCFYRIAYELQIRAYDSEEKEISAKLWDRYEVSKKMNLDFDDELKDLINLTRGELEMVKAKVVNQESAAVVAKSGKKAGPVQAQVQEDSTPKRRNACGCIRGLSRIDTYTAIFTENFRKKLTDDQLAEEMCNEFPQLKAYSEKDIRSHRGLFNHGKLEPQNGLAPTKVLPEYDEEGNAVIRQRGRKASGEESPDVPASPKKTEVKTSTVPKKVAATTPKKVSVSK